jgi:branched-subunit amino acid ABC-type transport system permease component
MLILIPPFLCYITFYKEAFIMTLFNRILTLTLSLLLICAPVGQAQAAIIANAQLIDQVQQANDKNVLLQTINRVEVQQQLLSMGVTTTELENRVNQMTQQEIAQLNQQINELPAGGDVLGIIVLIFIIFVITDVIGATDIFPFIHPVK